MTLTLDPKKYASMDVKPEAIWAVWRKFRVYLRRWAGEPVQYVAVLELQKSQMPHLHVLVDRFIPQGWISESWDRLGGGCIVDIRKVRGAMGAARYVAKYLTKGLRADELRGARRFSSSKGVSLKEEREGMRWKLISCGIDRLVKTAGGRILEEWRDANGEVTFFTLKDRLVPGWRSPQ